jgi:hypothetical protein
LVAWHWLRYLFLCSHYQAWPKETSNWIPKDLIARYCHSLRCKESPHSMHSNKWLWNPCQNHSGDLIEIASIARFTEMAYPLGYHSVASHEVAISFPMIMYSSMIWENANIPEGLLLVFHSIFSYKMSQWITYYRH